MLKGAVAKRYAQALFDVGIERGLLDQFQQDLAVITQILVHPDVARALENPKVPFSAKRELIRRFLGDRNPYVLNFVDLLMSKNRTPVIERIRESYQELYNAEKGIAVAEVTTAVPLADEEMNRLIKKLSQITGKQVILEPRVNESILGGLVVRIGDRVIDGSTITKLKALRAELAGAV